MRRITSSSSVASLVLVGLFACTPALLARPCAAQEGLARAEPAARVLVGRIGGEPALATALGSSLREQLFVDLRALDFEPLPTDGGCSDVDCARAFLGTGAADASVLVELFGSDGVCRAVQVSVVRADGRRFVGSAEVGPREVPEATRVALGQAVARSRGQARPTLSVGGSPPGARISLDGALWGILPHAEPVAPGAHTLVVAARGRRADRRELRLEGEDVHVEVALDPIASDDATPLWVGGFSTVALGVAALVVGVVGLADGGGCEGPGCVGSTHVDATPSVGAVVGGGVVAVAGGLCAVAAAVGSSDAHGEGSRALVRF